MQQLGFNISTYLPTYLPICIPEVLDVRVYLNLSSPSHRPLEVYGARIYLRELRDKCSCLLHQQLLLLLLVSINIIIAVAVAIAGRCRFKHIALALAGTTGIYYCLHIIRSLRTEELHHHHRSLRSVIPLILIPMSYIIIVVRRCE